MAALERTSKAPLGFVPASSGPEGGNRPNPKNSQLETIPSNPDAISMEEEDL